VHLALTRLKDLGNLPFASFRERVNGIQTYFNIDATEAFNLYKAAELLVAQRFEPQLHRILDDLNDPTASPTRGAAAKARPTTSTSPKNVESP
jgi:hypothetical protein